MYSGDQGGASTSEHGGKAPPDVGMSMVRRIGTIVASAIDMSVKAVGAVGIAGIFIMALIVTYEVIMRYVFHSPTRWVMEYSRFLLIITTLALAAYTLRQRKHVRSDIITVRLSTKWQQRLDILAAVVGIIYCSILSWASVVHTSYLRQQQVRSDLMWIPVWPIMVCVIIGAMLFGLQFTVDLIHSIKIFIGRRDREQQEAE